MARSFHHALAAAALLILTGLVTTVLAAPAEDVALPHVRSLPVSGWLPGTVVVDSHVHGSVRFIQNYVSLTTGDGAAVESKCSSDSKDFLKWSGRLAYQGAGYEQLSAAVATLALPSAAGSPAESAEVSTVLMRAARSRVVILYAYLDHWGIHAETPGLWPRAIGDLFARHPGPYCMTGVTVFLGRSRAEAEAEARDLARAFLPLMHRAIRR